MAGKKSTNNPATDKGPPALPEVEGTNAPVSKLRRTNLKAAAGAHSAKKPKAQNPVEHKEDPTTT